MAFDSLFSLSLCESAPFPLDRSLPSARWVLELMLIEGAGGGGSVLLRLWQWHVDEADFVDDVDSPLWRVPARGGISPTFNCSNSSPEKERRGVLRAISDGEARAVRGLRMSG